MNLIYAREGGGGRMKQEEIEGHGSPFLPDSPQPSPE